MMNTLTSGECAELATKATPIVDVPASNGSLESKTKTNMSKLKFRRRHLYPARIFHRRVNHLITYGMILVGVMSYIITSPPQPVEAQVNPPAVIVAHEPVPQLVGGTEAQNEVIKYAWEISNHNIEFIYTLNGENGDWNFQRVHNPRGNKVGTDLGFGINSWFHPEIVTDPRFFTDWKWQLDQTYKMWSGGVKFYGYSTKNIVIQ